MFDYSTYADSELVLQLKSGDRKAFDIIYDRYWLEAYRSAFQILRDEEVCMDIIQDIFVWLWENREKQEINVLKSYLLTAVRFKILNVIRRVKLREEIYAELPNPESIFVSEEENIEVKELKNAILNFKDNLPNQAKEIFYLSRFEFLSNKEIAQKMGIKEKTVKNQLNITLNKLRKALSESTWIIFFV